MPRRYTHMKIFANEMKTMREAGKTYREIAAHFNFKNREVVEEYFRRERRKGEKLKVGNTPKQRGRPRKDGQPPQQNPETELKRLRMENELLRDFLRLAGRR